MTIDSEVGASDGDNRKQNILNVATKLFCEKGYSGTRMSDIAAAIGVTKPIIYRYYSSKEELFENWVDLVLAENRDRLTDLIGNLDLGAKEVTKIILDKSLSGIGNQIMMAPWRIALVEAENFPKIAKLVCTKFKDPLLETVAQRFARAIADGELKGDPTILARLFCAPIASAAVVIATFGDASLPIEIVGNTFDAHYESFWRAWSA